MLGRLARRAVQIWVRPGLLAAVVAFAVLPQRLGAVRLEDLILHPKLTPKAFAAYFEDFEYEFGVEILPAEVFLRRRRGDCDDYAVLADHVFRRKNQPTRLIHVRMVGRVAHAICYVEGQRVYLDFNNRKFFFNVQRCGERLREIADKVAGSLEANWTSVSEFTYSYKEDVKRFGVTVVKTDPPSADADAAAAP